jgi:hypothetical protein
MNNLSVSRKFGVYEAHTPSNCPPDRWEEWPEVKRLLDNGDADRINRGKSIRMRSRITIPSKIRDLESSDQRGHSCRPGTGMHDPGARAIVLEGKPGPAAKVIVLEREVAL